MPPRLRPAPGTGKWWALGIAFTLAFTAFASWRVLSVADEQIRVTNLLWSIPDDRSLTASFEVAKPAGVRVVCTVEAQDLKRNTVGSTQVAVPAEGTVSTPQVTVRTTTQAFAAVVRSCVRA